VLTAVATVVVSLTVASAAASACTIEVQDEYTCYVTGSDANYCYYRCYCKTGVSACNAALLRDGFESY
jgi:hypothetical protein